MRKVAFFRSALALLLCLAMVLPFVPLQAKAVSVENTEVIAACDHQYGDWAQTRAPACATEGQKIRTCGLCGNQEVTAIAALGHDYAAVQYDSNCLHCAHIAYTCHRCGDSYKVYDESLYTDWQEKKPDVEESLIQTKQQYRYSDYETIFTDLSLF